MPRVAKGESSRGLQSVHYYPAPLSTHDEVVNDSVVFWDTLRRFHFMMNTRFMIPVIGGKELDLHMLYVEVTKRGGYEKVVEEKKWREVGTIFMFSPTTTSASFVLRKHYRSLLFSYEQVYFCKKQGPICSPPALSPVSFSISKRKCSNKPEVALVQYSSEMPKLAEPIPECLIPGSEGTGMITGKFDCGYLITVRLGSEVLKGVLYHPEEPVHSDGSPEPINVRIPDTKRSRRQRRSRRRDDPNHPKPNRSGYNFFFAEKHCKFKSLYPNREREFTKMIGESWSNLTAEERMVYQNIGVKDKERYKRELEEYKEKKKLRQSAEVNRDTEVIRKAKEESR
ncbi:high mobility group B protein 9 [Argentina anserina]|uniref:high mobility group B protein 9 n=1 Tax=Argentina anserina TaxID=57926 RepID=UPI0021763E29|nr:high mobility group B protein 9 [Potentilla anserina]